SRLAVPAVPDAESVEAGDALEPGDPREQDDLQESAVGAEQAGEPRDAGQRLAGRVHAGDVPAVPPEPDDRDEVPEQQAPDRRGDDLRAKPDGSDDGAHAGAGLDSETDFAHADKDASAVWAGRRPALSNSARRPTRAATRPTSACCSGRTSVTPAPPRPARPVRPTRWR